MIFPCSRDRRRSLRAVTFLTFIVSLTTTVLHASEVQLSYSIFHSFGEDATVPDGRQPGGALVQGSDGNFYGTTSYGGSANKGTVYEITALNKVVILHSFGDGSVLNDGRVPHGALVQGTNGNFYGTTEAGGAAQVGTVFEISTSGNVTILHSFEDLTVDYDGRLPMSGLIQGSDGNFYGTTLKGGANSFGTVFKMTPSGAETVLHSFGDSTLPGDGKSPSSGLCEGSDGNFFGTTDYGGGAGEGTFYEISLVGLITIHYSFGADGPDGGIYPRSGVIEGADGSFYGTTYLGGAGLNGTIYQITPQGIEVVLHSFLDGTVPHDGYFVNTGLLEAVDGDLYGTTYFGGIGGSGTVFKVTKSGSYTLLHSFNDNTVTKDGSNSNSNLINTPDGKIFGVTQFGGRANGGTIYCVDPGIASKPGFVTSASPMAITAQDNIASVVLTVTPTAEFSGTVALDSGQLPPFLHTGFDTKSLTLSHSSQSVIVTWTLSTTANPGIWPLKLVATSGSITRLTSVALVIPAAEPRILSIRPTNISIGGSISILGRNLAGASLVDFTGGVSAVPKEANSHAVTVIVPIGAQSGTVSIDTPTANVTSKDTLSISLTP